MARAIALLILLFAIPAYATQYNVGGASDWTQGVTYSNWLSGKTFFVGDDLVFIYTSLHSVDEVNQSDYNSCTTSNPITTNTGGNTTIPLTAVGTRYFICGTPGHCTAGMKIAVTTSAGTSAATPPSTTPSTTTPTGTVSSPPPPSGASHHMTSIFALGASMVLAIVCAL